jgi:hypothetical protein
MRILLLTGVHQLRMRQRDRRQPDNASRWLRRRGAIGAQFWAVPGKEPNVRITLPLPVAIPGSRVPDNVLYVSGHNAGSVGNSQVSRLTIVHLLNEQGHVSH